MLLVANLNMRLSNKRIAKVLIRLRRCAGWSWPLLFTNPEDRFSCHFPIIPCKIPNKLEMSPWDTDAPAIAKFV